MIKHIFIYHSEVLNSVRKQFEIILDKRNFKFSPACKYMFFYQFAFHTDKYKTNAMGSETFFTLGIKNAMMGKRLSNDLGRTLVYQHSPNQILSFFRYFHRIHECLWPVGYEWSLVYIWTQVSIKI